MLGTVLGAGIEHKPLMEECTVCKGFRRVEIVIMLSGVLWGRPFV